MAARFGSRGAGFSFEAPHQQPSAEAWPDAEDEAISCIPMPFGLERPGRDLGSADSSDGGRAGRRSRNGGRAGSRYAHTAVQQPTTHSPSQAPEPFMLPGDGSLGPDACGDRSRREGSGLNGRTTVMIRRTPQSLTQRKLAWELSAAGFSGLYDYVYIPVDRGLLARPMAFVNFTSGEAAERFFQAFNGRQLQSCGSVEPVFVIPATVQGLAPNLAHHLACMRKNTDGRQKSELGPLFMI